MVWLEDLFLIFTHKKRDILAQMNACYFLYLWILCTVVNLRVWLFSPGSPTVIKYLKICLIAVSYNYFRSWLCYFFRIKNKLQQLCLWLRIFFLFFELLDHFPLTKSKYCTGQLLWTAVDGPLLQRLGFCRTRLEDWTLWTGNFWPCTSMVAQSKPRLLLRLSAICVALFEIFGCILGAADSWASFGFAVGFFGFFFLNLSLYRDVKTNVALMLRSGQLTECPTKTSCLLDFISGERQQTNPG